MPRLHPIFLERKTVWYENQIQPSSEPAYSFCWWSRGKHRGRYVSDLLGSGECQCEVVELGATLLSGPKKSLAGIV